MDLKITNTTPSTITVAVGDHTVSIGGEALVPGFGSPDFVIYKNSVKNWNAPFEKELIDPDTVDEIVAEVVQILLERKWKVEVE